MAKAFHLSVVTPDGLFYDGEAESITVRSADGDISILAGHSDYLAPLGMGATRIVIDGKERYAASIGGMISVNGGEVRLVPTTFEWADEIDINRARRAKEEAERQRASTAEKTNASILEAKLRRAILRIGVSERYSSGRK